MNSASSDRIVITASCQSIDRHVQRSRWRITSKSVGSDGIGITDAIERDGLSEMGLEMRWDRKVSYIRYHEKFKPN